MPDKTEIWKPIAGWTKYEVSSLGRVRNVVTGHVIAPFVKNKKKGYKAVVLVGPRGVRQPMISGLVAEAFIGPRPSLEITVNHIDGVKTNDAIENLEYCTRAENNKHAARLGLFPRGEKHRGAKLTAAIVVAARKRYNSGGITYRELAEQYGVGGATMRSAIIGRRWKHVG